MLKPSEIIYKIRKKLKYETESGLGRSGFKCDHCVKIDDYMGHECFLKLYAKHVHSVGMLNNWVECYVIISFYPSKSKGKFNDDGYSYHCQYKKCFWESFYPSDFKALLNKLFDTICNHFDYNNECFSKEDGNEAITFALYKDLSSDSFYL